MKRITKFRIIIASLIVLLVMSITGLFLLQRSNKSLHSELDQQRLKSEALLSEKLLVEKDLERTKQSNENLEDDKFNLARTLEHKVEVVSTQTAENKRIKKALRFAEETLEAERAASKDLKDKLADGEGELKNVTKVMSDSIAMLQSNIASLQHSLNEAILTSIDQTQVTGLKKRNGRITSKARAVNKLVANVRVPGVLSDLNFVVEGPDGSVISDREGTVAAQVVNEDETFTASARESGYQTLQPQTVQITYTPENKLRPGTYTLKIFNNSKYVGSMKVELR